jgi:nitroreductase
MLERQSKYDLHSSRTPVQIREKLRSLFEAARWAPSHYNEQPWRFVYVIQGTSQWDKLFKLLAPGNQRWADQADALILVISKNVSDRTGKSNPTHTFDTGLAAAQIFLQATTMGLVAHGMSGFDYGLARKELKLPKEYTVEAMIAIGETAPKEYSRKDFAERDAKVATRKHIEEFAFEGSFLS